MGYLEDCLRRKVIFFTGKGGVGKSTLAWATALLCRDQGLRVRVVTWNPFGSDRVSLPAERWNIGWEPLETLTAFKEYALRTVRFETLYNVAFENHVLKTFIRAAPGLSETVISGKIWDLYQKAEQDLLIVDLPASGHAISFFQSPLGISRIFAVGFVHKEAGKIVDLFGAETTRLDLVTLPEELPLVETKELKAKLESIHPFHFGFLHMNQRTPEFGIDEATKRSLPPPVRDYCEQHEERVRTELEAIREVGTFGLPQISIPKLAGRGMIDTLEAVSKHLKGGS